VLQHQAPNLYMNDYTFNGASSPQLKWLCMDSATNATTANNFNNLDNNLQLNDINDNNGNDINIINSY